MVASVTAADRRAEDLAPVGHPLPLIDAKLHTFAPATGTVERPRLLASLLDREGPPVVALVAGPGYGKTTLLAQWARAETRPVAWLTLDGLDNDPAILVSYLDAAVARIDGDRDGQAPPVSRGARRRGPGVAPLLERLHRSRQPIVLVLDDVHQVTDHAALDALATVLDHLPAGVRVAIAGRHDPALPLGRWRAGRHLLDIGEPELALDEAETAAVVSSAGWAADADAVRALAAETEGWAAATYLAALAHVRHAASPITPAGITGRDRFIAAYLRSEVTAVLDGDDVDLLAQTSVLVTVTPDAAIALTGIESAASRLQAIARRGLLVHEVGTGSPAFRYHNLLRGFMLEELEHEHPGATRGLHARAAAWYAAEGSHELAVEHALLSGDAVTAARLATAAALPTLYAGRSATLDRWLGTFDEAAYRAYPPLAVVAAWTHIVGGRADAADRMADVVDGARFDGLPADGASSFDAGRWMLRSVMCRRGPSEALANAELAVVSEAASRWRTTTLWLAGSLRSLVGDVPGAEAALEAATPSTPTAAGAAALAKLAALRLREGDWAAADSLAARASAMLRDSRWDARLAAFFVHAVAARVAITRGDLATGRAELVRAQLVRPTASHAAPWLSVDALLELARAYLAISDPGGAQTALREAEAIIRHRPGLGTLVRELVEVRRRIGGATDALAGSSTLTSAELRVLPLLPTYLSFQDIADRLGISRNTVKTHAMSIYGKLWASSRGEAVERAVELGLLEPYPGLGGFRGAGADAIDEEAG